MRPTVILRVTPHVGSRTLSAQAFHGDQVVELRVQLAVQEVEGKEEEDREGQVEVEEEKRTQGGALMDGLSR